MVNRLALTVDGNITYCSASEENIGKGRCNHIAHQKECQSKEDFIKSVNNEDKFEKIKNLEFEDLKKLYDKGEDINLLKQVENRDFLKYMISKGETEFKDLLKTKDIQLKIILASYGLHIDELKNDKHEFIREEVANQGYALEELVNDDSGEVRATVASHGYGLDKLIDDDYEFVRAEVARQGYGLDVLINDEDEVVRYEARKAKRALKKKNKQ